jgi:hypothetical protein
MEIHFHLGKDHFKKELDLSGSQLNNGLKGQSVDIENTSSSEGGEILNFRKKSKPLEKYLAKGQQFLTDTCSNSLTNGGGGSPSP